MAINVRCKKCKTEMKLSAKRCKKCGAPIPQKGKTYKVTVRQNGKKITRTTNNLELAREIEGKLKVKIARDEYDLKKKKPAPTLNQVWDKYLPWAKENKKTWDDDECNFRKHIAPTLGDNRLDAISPFDIEKLVLTMKKKKTAKGTPYAPATIKHQLVLLTRLYSIAEQWGLYSGSNPCKKVKKPKLNNKKTEFLSDEELKNLLDTLDGWKNKMTVAFIKFAMFTGFRRGELFKLTWGDVDLRRHMVTLRDPKGKEDQVLPLSEKAAEVLKSVPKEYDTPWIFYGKNGKQRTDFKGPWKRIRKAAGLPDDFRFHGLRHHFASSLVSAGTDLYVVQKLLTHKDASTTQRYAHLADKALRDAVKLSDELLKPKEKAQVVNFKERRHGK